MSLQECYFLTVQPNQGVFYNELETRCVLCVCVYMCMCICTYVHLCMCASMLAYSVYMYNVFVCTYIRMCVLCTLHMRYQQ